ncbi:hypothetical protein Tco_0357387 [Tanacetum coccineum]
MVIRNPLENHKNCEKIGSESTIALRSSTYELLKNSYELRANLELKDKIVMAMPKITREGHYTFNFSVEYEWKPPRCSSCKVFVRNKSSQDLILPRRERSNTVMVKAAELEISMHGDYYGMLIPHTLGTYYKSSQPLVLFLDSSKVTNTLLRKELIKAWDQQFLDIIMRNVRRIQVLNLDEVSNSNPFDVINSVDNDVEFGTNRGTTNLVNNEATSCGSSFMNVGNSSSDTTPIIDKVWKFEDLLTSGQAILRGIKWLFLLKKVEFLGEYDSEDEVASIDNDMARSMASERVGQDLSHELQAKCDNLDIRVRDRKKK